MSYSKWIIFVLVGVAGCQSALSPQQLRNEPIGIPGQSTLYDRLGGGSAIYAITDRFLDKAMHDQRVNFTRAGHAHSWEAKAESIGRLKLYFAQYLDMLCDGPQLYEGKNLLETHHGMDISQGEWIALLDDLEQTLEAMKVPPDDRKELLTRVNATQGVIVNQ